MSDTAVQRGRLWVRQPAEGTKRVLIIDDDHSLLSLLRLLFRTASFDVVATSDVAAALLTVGEDAPDVIVLDLEMPVMNGRAFYRALRAEGIDTPVLILSAYGARTAQVELGAEGYLDKPFDPDRLIEAATSLIR